MSLVKTPADDSKTVAAEDHAVADATKSSRPTAKDAALLAFVSSIGPFAANAYVPAFDEIGRYYGVGSSPCSRRFRSIWPHLPVRRF